MFGLAMLRGLISSPHGTDKRWIFVVAHQQGREDGRLGQPSHSCYQREEAIWPCSEICLYRTIFDAAKDLVRGYLKHYTRGVPGIKYMEGELSVTLPNQAQIRLLSAARWLTSGCVEFIWMGPCLTSIPSFIPSAFTSVVRALSWLIIVVLRLFLALLLARITSMR